MAIQEAEKVQTAAPDYEEREEDFHRLKATAIGIVQTARTIDDIEVWVMSLEEGLADSPLAVDLGDGEGFEFLFPGRHVHVRYTYRVGLPGRNRGNPVITTTHSIPIPDLPSIGCPSQEEVTA